MKKATAVISFLILIILHCGTSMPTYAQVANEATVKAAFLLNFARFTTWPATTNFAEGIQICAVGTAPLEDKLAALTNQKVQNNAIRVVTTKALPETLDHCHLLFLTDASAAQLQQLAALTTPVLTITDSADADTLKNFMIRLHQREGRIRFDVNLALARKAGLNLSAQLLELANEVQR
jgi:hypothetical protein